MNHKYVGTPRVRNGESKSTSKHTTRANDLMAWCTTYNRTAVPPMAAIAEKSSARCALTAESAVDGMASTSARFIWQPPCKAETRPGRATMGSSV